MTARALGVVWDPKFRSYDFGPGHPFDETSREFAVRLLEGSLSDPQRAAIDWVRDVPPADEQALRSFHSEAYLERVRRAGAEADQPPLDSGDTPSFLGCFQASARIVGGTDRAVRRTLEQGGISFAPGGGLHHAHPNRASGFCIFNDLAVGIASALRAHRRVAYLDIDVHHGDGVMYGFYRSGNVLDIDFHQDGDTLFPGTGRISETGEGDGAGLKVNVPLPPRAGDEALVPLFRRLVPPLLRDFRPDLVVMQHGVDGHWGDPLARLQYTPSGYAAVDRLVLELVQDLECGLVVTGGGGYQPESVSRVLARTGYLLAGLPLPSDDAALPEDWKVEFYEAFGALAPSRWVDPPDLVRPTWGAEDEAWLVRNLEKALGRRFPAP